MGISPSLLSALDASNVSSSRPGMDLLGVLGNKTTQGSSKSKSADQDLFASHLQFRSDSQAKSDISPSTMTQKASNSDAAQANARADIKSSNNTKKVSHTKTKEVKSDDSSHVATPKSDSNKPQTTPDQSDDSSSDTDVTVEAQARAAQMAVQQAMKVMLQNASGQPKRINGEAQVADAKALVAEQSDQADSTGKPMADLIAKLNMTPTKPEQSSVPSIEENLNAAQKTANKQNAASDTDVANAILTELKNPKDLSTVIKKFDDGQYEKLKALSAGLNGATSSNDASKAATDGKGLKQLADSLWIQKNLKGPSGDVSSNLAMQQLQTPQQVSFSDAMAATAAGSSSADEVKSNLVQDMKPLLNQVITTKDGGEMTLNLRPGNLGAVRVDIQVDSGSVKVVMQTEQSNAKSFLQNNANDLRDQLTAAGLKVNEVSVSSMSTHQGNSNKSHDSQQWKQGSTADQQQNRQEAQSERQSKNNQGRMYDDSYNYLDDELNGRASV